MRSDVEREFPAAFLKLEPYRDQPPVNRDKTSDSLLLTVFTSGDTL